MDSPPIIDTHQHLWDLKRFDLPWLTSASPTINRTFDLDDFEQAAAELNVARTVYMEVDVTPSQQREEAAFAIGICRDPASRVAGAVIGGSPHLKEFGRYLKCFADEDCVKGVRMVLHTADRPSSLCLEPRFVESMKRLGDADLSFDLCMRPDELLTGARLAAKCPETRFVLDHCGGIGVGTVAPQVRERWRAGIQALAGQENIVCKISGLIDKQRGDQWAAEELADAVNTCLDAFGEDRVLFGGDWPVCLLGGTYRRWVEALQAIVADRSETFRRKLFHGNAMRVYSLKPC